MKRIVLVTGHYLQSRRKAGFHWLADSFRAAGWDVLFLTAPISWLSWLRRDHRFNYPVRREANRVRQVKERLHSFVWFTPWHPANFRLGFLNQLAAGIIHRYAAMPLGEAEPFIQRADMVIFESTPALVLFDRVRALTPKAQLIYRVSDDLHLLRNHPHVLETESRVAPQFDLVSVPCKYLLDRFRHVSNVRLHPHGVRMDRFDVSMPSPYSGPWRKHAVFVGNDRFDHDFLARASGQFPELAFHIIGPVRHLAPSPNVIAYGELPFEQTVPYLCHADIGLHNLAYEPGAESFSDSLKVLQYTYCRLPVVMPEFLTSSRNNVCSYRPGDDASIARAIRDAETFDRSRIDRSGILSWNDVRDALLEDALAVAGDVQPSRPCHAAS